MQIKAVAGFYGLIFLSAGMIMFSNLEPAVKMWLLRALLMVVAETIFVLSVFLMWKINNIPLRRMFHGSKVFAYALASGVALVLFMSHLSLLFINLFYTADVPNLLKFSLSCLGLYVQFFAYALTLTCLCRPILIVLDRWNRVESYKRSVAKVQTAIFYATAAASLGLTVYGFVNAGRPPAVEHIQIKLKDFPRSMNGFKILMMTDVHFGLTVDRARMDQIMSVIGGLDYDLLAAIGDFTDLPAARAGLIAKPLKEVEPRYGKFFVTGNHEYYNSDVEDWLKHLSDELGFRVLRNENVRVARGNDSFRLAGVDDIEARIFRMKGHGMDLEKALQGCEKNASVVLLAHQPRAAKRALDESDLVDLVLSGHTHGGQMFPMLMVIYWTNPFITGLYAYGPHGAQVYVSQGAVYWGIPLRILSRAEVNVVHLFRDE